MQRSAERHKHVYSLPVVEANDGIHAFGELGANWKGQKKGKLGTLKKKRKIPYFIDSKVIKVNKALFTDVAMD